MITLNRFLNSLTLFAHLKNNCHGNIKCTGAVYPKGNIARITGEEAAEILRDQPGTPHEILGISIPATQSEIRKAYMVLIKKWHPDNNPDKVEQATEMAKKIIAAYTTLKK